MNVQNPTAVAHRGWRAIVADDDDDTRSLMAEALRRAGFSVSQAEDGDELVRLCEAAADGGYLAQTVVVSDIDMPQCDGIRATLRLRNATIDAPILLVSAYDDPTLMRAARRAGANQILSKPVARRLLVDTVLALANGMRPPKTTQAA